MNYRPEIDGLRAVAVLPVILFHAGFSAFGGGFVGVDIFFVISGYLITSIIAEDLTRGTFSFLNFYERRARRILPALLLVVICSIPFAWKWMMPMELKSFSASVVAVCSFISNIFFWQQSGYFDATAEIKPLLHTWSLAVEEQFYILFPIAMLTLWQFGRKKAIAAIALVAIVSLALSEYGSRYHPAFNFYWLPTRAWELAAGSLCAFTAFRSHALRDNSLSIVGLAAIVFAVFSFDSSTPFPSVYALVPVLGACAIVLFARAGTIVAWMLSTKAVVGIGLISYSAYLWHQPLFAFSRIRSLTEPSWQFMLSLASCSLLLAYLTWKFVEIPARKRSTWPWAEWRTAFVVNIALLSFLITSRLAGYFTNGAPLRFGDALNVSDAEQRLKPSRGLSTDCEGFNFLFSSCQTSGEPGVVVWGDSYAMFLTTALAASAPNVGVIQMTTSLCGPFIGLAPTDADHPISWAERCMSFNDSVMRYIATHKAIKLVILSSRFGQYVDDGSKVLLRNGVTVRGADVALQYFVDTLDELSRLGVKAVVIAPPPSPGFDAGNCLKRAMVLGWDLSWCSFSLQDAENRDLEVRSFLHSIEKRNGVVWLDSAVCNGDLCSVVKDGKFIYSDVGHWTSEGSSLVGEKVDLYHLVNQQ